MKKCILFVIALLMMLSSCKEAVPEGKTILGIFTPFYRSPAVLNGKVESFKMRTYWAIEEDGKIKKGEIITRTERDSLGFMSDFNLYYNEKGLIEKTEYIMKDGKINHTNFEIENNMIIGGKYFVNGNQRRYFRYEYDDSEYLIKMNAYRFGADTLIATTTLNNLENGNPAEKIYLNYKNEITGTRKLIWKKKDFISEYQSFNIDGDLFRSMKVEYDENDISKSIIYDYPNRLTKYEFTDIILDDMGNMASSVFIKNDIVFAVVEYIIEYYEEP